MTESAIRKKIASTLASLSQTGPVLKGTISKARTGHQITWKAEGNKTKILYVPDARLEEAREMVEGYKKAKELLERLAQLNAELYKATAR